VPAAGREPQRRPDRDPPQAATRVEHVEEAEQVVLVGAATVQEDDGALGVARRRALEVDETSHWQAPWQNTIDRATVSPHGTLLIDVGRGAAPADIDEGHQIAITTTTAATTDGLDERELKAWRGLLRVHARISKALDVRLEAEHGLPLTSYEVLRYLADAEGQRMRMCDLASSVILSRSGLTRLVDRLERDGLLARESCSSDARGAFAKLTPAGQQKLAAARATHLAGVRSLFLDHLDDEALDLLAGVWDGVLAGVPAGDCGC
jgi:DNA-binding MarR family transcriptional regulator